MRGHNARWAMSGMAVAMSMKADQDRAKGLLEEFAEMLNAIHGVYFDAIR
jgi:hypothetical protein